MFVPSTQDRRLVNGVRIGLVTWLGLGAGLFGVALLLNGGGSVSVVASGAVVLASLGWAGASLYARRTAPEGRPLTTAGLQMLTAAGLLAVASVTGGEYSHFHALTFAVGGEDESLSVPCPNRAEVVAAKRQAPHRRNASQVVYPNHALIAIVRREGQLFAIRRNPGKVVWTLGNIELFSSAGAVHQRDGQPLICHCGAARDVDHRTVR